MTDVKIEKNVPIPPVKRGRPSSYGFKDMEVGDSFFVPSRRSAAGKLEKQELTMARISNALARYRKHHPEFNITRRSVTEDGVAGIRVWRVEDREIPGDD